MQRAKRETTTPTTPQWPAVPDAERTVESLAHEYRVVVAKMKYDLEADPDRSDERSDAIIDPAHERQHEIMTEIGRRRLTTAAECEAGLQLVLADAAEDVPFIDVHHDLIHAVFVALMDMAMIEKGGKVGEARAAIVAGLTGKEHPAARAASEATLLRGARELENDVHCLVLMADMVSETEDQANSTSPTPETERLQFVISQMLNMAKAFEERYRATLWPDQSPRAAA